MKTENKKELFYEEMKASLLRLKPEKMEIEFREVTKHNRKNLHGCVLIMPGSAAAPTFYMEDLYPAYEGGTSVDDIAEKLIDYAKYNVLHAVPGNIDINDYGRVKENLGLIVLGTARNREYLSDLVHEDFEDLAIVPIIFTNDYHGPGQIKVHKDFLELWNISEQELLKQAKENAPNLLPVTFRQIGEHVSELDPLDKCEMFVVSNAYYAGGASVVFYPRVLECIASAVGKNLFVLPSSVNEMIIVTDNGQDPEQLLTIVREVNRTQVAPGEVLADSVYYYSSNSDRLRKILPMLA